MKYHYTKTDSYYSSVIPYQDGVIKGKYNNEFYYNDFLIASDADTASGVAVLYCNLLFYSSNSKGYCFDLNALENERLLGSIIFSTYHNNTYLSISDLDENDWSYKLDLLMFKPSKVLLSFPNRYFGNFYRFGNLVLNVYRRNDSMLLSSLSLVTGSQNWQTDLSSYGKIRKIVGVVEDNLWVTLTKSVEQENSLTDFEETLVVIHTKTGSITNVFVHNYLFSSVGVLLNDKNQTIVSLKGNRFIEYNTKTSRKIRDLEVQSLTENKLNVRSFTVFKDKVYVTANDSTQVVANVVGVLDYNTLELLWFSKVYPGNLNLNPPQVTEDKLYVLGAEGTLHIFEKDKEVV